MVGTTDSPLRTWGLVLAAGTGARFGGAKLLARYRGAPLIEAVLRVVRKGIQEEVLAGGVAVIPPPGGELEQLVRDHGLDPVVNDDPAAGMAHSLRAGLGRLSPVAGRRDGVVVFLGDQPRVRATVLHQLVDAFRRDPAPVHRPVYRDHPEVPGHPVIIPRQYWQLVDALEGDAGFGPLFGRREIPVRHLEVPGDNPGINLPEDLARLESETR